MAQASGPGTLMIRRLDLHKILVTAVYFHRESGIKPMKRPQSGRRRFLQGTEGMSAVEMALVLPVLLLIICGVMDFGNLYLQWNIASEAAREGARMAAINPAGSTTPKSQADVESFIQSNYGDTLTITMSPSPATAGSPVTVTVSKPITFFTPGIKAMFPEDFTSVSGKSVMQAESST